MPIDNGTVFDTEGKYAPGTSHDAGVRGFRNVFTLAGGSGGTTNQLKVARVREHNIIDSAILASDANLSAITFTLGTKDDPEKYAAAFAGPAAGATVQIPIKPAMLAMDVLPNIEEFLLTPSAALPATGTVIAKVRTTKR